jgi:hypothetical protein
MQKRSNKHRVQRSAGELPWTSPEEIERIGSIPDDAIDPSDCPELQGNRRPVREAPGRPIPPNPGPIARIILRRLGRLQMTRYELWKGARDQCPTLSQSAVYGFLRGDRDIGVKYLEAILDAAGLRVGTARSTT